VSLRLERKIPSVTDELETWDLWLPGPGANGLSFARARVNAKDAQDRILVHAAPQKLQVTVRDQSGNVLARGDRLERHQPGPMSYLVRRGASITLEDGWPGEQDIGRLVLLPGGEAGILKSWWNADDRKEWRWQIEFYNQIRS
jgi:hypothetical protein